MGRRGNPWLPDAFTAAAENEKQPGLPRSVPSFAMTRVVVKCTRFDGRGSVALMLKKKGGE